MPETIRQVKKDDRSPDQRKADFLEAMKELVNVSKSARKAGVGRSRVYEWIKTDPEFKKSYDEAIEVGASVLEDEAVRRAVKGTLKPIYYKGKKVGSVREYSDTLLIFLLKGINPDKYKDRIQQEHKGIPSHPPQVNVYNTAPPLAGSEDEIDQ